MPTTQLNIQVQAEGQVEALVLPAVCLSGLVRENLYVENFMYRSSTGHFAQVMGAVETLLFSTLEQRLVRYLLEEEERLHTDTLKMCIRDSHSARSEVRLYCVLRLHHNYRSCL